MSEKRNETELMPELTLTPFEEESPKMEKVVLENQLQHLIYQQHYLN